MKNTNGRNRESIIEDIQQSMSSSSGEKLCYEEASEIADTLYTLADIAIDHYLENKAKVSSGKEIHSKSSRISKSETENSG